MMYKILFNIYSIKEFIKFLLIYKIKILFILKFKRGKYNRFNILSKLSMRALKLKRNKIKLQSNC